MVGSRVAASACLPARPSAQGNVPIVRDAEIEALVRDYARPIFKAAGLSKSGIDIILVNDPSFNAFVAGRRMFINTGALLQAETPNEIIGVIAHEAGHIAGGHQERLRDQIARAQTMAIVASAARRRRHGCGRGRQIQRTRPGRRRHRHGRRRSGATRGLLGYQRSEETTADRSAITYLEATGQSAKGMLKTFKRFQSALSLSGAQGRSLSGQPPDAARPHRQSGDTWPQASPYFDVKDPPALQQRHDMMRAKIAVYTQGQTAASRLFRKAPDGLAANSMATPWRPSCTAICARR